MKTLSKTPKKYKAHIPSSNAFGSPNHLEKSDKNVRLHLKTQIIIIIIIIIFSLTSVAPSKILKKM